jgi:hypothetical protein
VRAVMKVTCAQLLALLRAPSDDTQWLSKLEQTHWFTYLQVGVCCVCAVVQAHHVCRAR